MHLSCIGKSYVAVQDTVLLDAVPTSKDCFFHHSKHGVPCLHIGEAMSCYSGGCVTSTSKEGG